MTVSKLTSISLCDKANTVQDSISKANRGFNSTESILHTRNNSYTKKVYSAFSNSEDLSKVSITKGIVDIARLESDIKVKIANELSEINSSFLSLITRNKEEYKYSSFNGLANGIYGDKSLINYREDFISKLHNILFKIVEEGNPTTAKDISESIKALEECIQKENDDLQLFLELNETDISKVHTLILTNKSTKEIYHNILEENASNLQIAFNLINLSKQTYLESLLDKVIYQITRIGEILFQTKQDYITAINSTTSIITKLNLTHTLAIILYSNSLEEYYTNSISLNNYLIFQNKTLFPLEYYIDQAVIDNKFLSLKSSLNTLNKNKLINKSKDVIRLQQIELDRLIKEYNHLVIKYSIPFQISVPNSIITVYFAYANFLQMTISAGLVGFTDGITWANEFRNQVIADRISYYALDYGDPAREQYAYAINTSFYNLVLELIPKNRDESLEPKVNSVIYSKPDAMFYANKYLLHILGHPTLRQIYPGWMDNRQLHKIIKVDVDINNPSIIRVSYKLDFVTNKINTLEFVIPSTDVNHVVCTFNNGYSGYDEGESYLFYTDEDFDFKIKDSIELDKKFIPYISIKEDSSFVSTEENTLLLKKLFIPFTQLSKNISKLDNLSHIPNIGIQLGISTNTLDANCCKYLIQFFEDIQVNSSSKEEFNNYDLSTYLFENIITFTSRSNKTKIGFSYIEINTKQGVITPKSSIYSSINYEIEFSPILGIAADIAVDTYITRDSIFYDFSRLKVTSQISKTEYKEVIVHGFTYTNEYLTDRSIKPVENYIRRLGLYESTLSKTILKYRKETDTVRNEFKSSKDCSVVIPLIYYDIFDANSDYHRKKMCNILENLYYDSINLIVSSGLKEEEYKDKSLNTYIKPTDRDALLLTYLDYFINKKPNEVYIRKREEDKTSYELFRDSNYVGIGLSYYNTNPEYLKHQKKREAEVRNLLMQGNKSNLYNDRDSHTNNALTGVYKPIVFIEPFINIGDKYKKPMFNN